MKKMDRACFERMQAEQKELAERLSKLNRFLEKNWMSVSRWLTTTRSC